MGELIVIVVEKYCLAGNYHLYHSIPVGEFQGCIYIYNHLLYGGRPEIRFSRRLAR